MAGSPDSNPAASASVTPPDRDVPATDRARSVPVLFVTSGPGSDEVLASDDEVITVRPVTTAGLFSALEQSGRHRDTPNATPNFFGAVVLLDGVEDLTATLSVAAHIDRDYPMVVTLLVAESTSEVFAAAMRAGVRDVVAPDAQTGQIMEAVRRAREAVVARSRAVEMTAASDAPRGGRVITVTSPKGGSGKTTVTTNLAVELGRRHPAEVVVVDFDLQFGDIASCLRLEPSHSVIDAVSAIASDDVVLKSYLSAHESGCFALCAPASPADGEKIGADEISQLVQRLASSFPFVLIDTAPGLLEATLAALDASDDVVFVSGMDVPSVRGLHRELAVLDELHLLDLRRHVVVNFVDRRSGLTIDDIEAMLGLPVGVELPRSKAVPLSTNRGVPLLQETSRGPVVRGLRSLTNNLDDATARRAARRTAKDADTDATSQVPGERRRRASSRRATGPVTRPAKTAGARRQPTNGDGPAAPGEMAIDANAAAAVPGPR